MGISNSKRGKKRKSEPAPEIAQDEKEKLDAAMNFLKSVVVNDANLEEIKEKLIETMKHRHDLMKNQRMDIKETVPVFFACPELVCGVIDIVSF